MTNNGIEMTAAELRERAAKADAAKEESFQRCDTDGFLSQWANGVNAGLDRERAELVENGRKARFKGLYDGDRRVMAKLFSKVFYGNRKYSWVLDDAEEARYGRRFIPADPFEGRSRIQKTMGLRERFEIDDAWADLASNGTGLSGQVWVEVYRTGDKWGGDAELVLA